jgi:hypothetical protein
MKQQARETWTIDTTFQEQHEHNYEYPKVIPKLSLWMNAHSETGKESEVFHAAHICACACSSVRSLTNSTTLHTSSKLLARPKLTRTTPSRWPTSFSRASMLISGISPSRAIGPCNPRSAAAPPGLHMQPVRREMLRDAEAWAMKSRGKGLPKGW